MKPRRQDLETHLQFRKLQEAMLDSLSWRHGLSNKQVKIAILCIGSVSTETLRVIQNGLREAFPKTDCTVLEGDMPIPENAYNHIRRQYHSTHILAKIKEFARSDVDHVLGVIDVDLYVPRLNFVFGEAYSPGKVAIISLFRLKQEFYGHPPDTKLFLERAVKEAVHEIGHTMSLGHCENRLCVMFFSNSIVDTDRKRAVFCEKCYQMVAKRLK